MYDKIRRYGITYAITLCLLSPPAHSFFLLKEMQNVLGHFGLSALIATCVETAAGWCLPYQSGFTRKPRRFQGDPAVDTLKRIFILSMLTAFCFFRAAHHAPPL